MGKDRQTDSAYWTNGGLCIFISSVLVHGRTDNEQMAGYVYARDFHPNWQANASQRMQISRIICQSSPGYPLLGPRGHFNRPSFTIVSLSALFLAFLFSLSLCSPISSLHPFFPLPVQSIGRVSRLKRHLLISFLSSPFLSRIFLLEYTYVHTCVCKRTRCSNWKLIFESIGER